MVIILHLLAGYGDMAISNAVGSNVFDVLLCLGLPWFLNTVVVNPNTTVQVYSSGTLVKAHWLCGKAMFTECFCCFFRITGFTTAPSE